MFSWLDLMVERGGAHAAQDDRVHFIRIKKSKKVLKKNVQNQRRK